MNIYYLWILGFSAGFYCLINGLLHQRYTALIAAADDSYPGSWGYAYPLWLIEIIGISRFYGYNARLGQKIAALQGKRYLPFHLQMHWSYKILMAHLGVWLGCFLSYAGEAGYFGVVIIFGSGAALFWFTDSLLEDRMKKKQMALRMAFPAFLSKLVLLVQAGLQVRQAMERIVETSETEDVMAQEIQLLLRDFSAGIPESEAFQEFSDRCHLREIHQFSGMIQFNLKMGGAHLLKELRLMNNECWDNRKQLARQLGEIASSKLVFPLSLMFLAVILIVMAPALMNLGNLF